MVMKRIDNEGRIYIPLEFRKNLGLSIGEYVSISCNQFRISIKKTNFQNKYDDIIKKIVIPFDNIFSCDIVVVDRNKIIYSSNKTLISKKINKELISFFDLLPNIYEKYFLSITNDFCFQYVSYIFPILEEGYPIGLVILNNQNRIDKHNLKFLYELINS